MVQNGCKIRSFLPIFSLFGCFFPCFVDGISNIYIDSRYIGKFKNNKRNGKAINIYANGNKYIGEVKNDLKHGYGIYTWANGAKYEGE